MVELRSRDIVQFGVNVNVEKKSMCAALSASGHSCMKVCPSMMMKSFVHVQAKHLQMSHNACPVCLCQTVSTSMLKVFLIEVPFHSISRVLKWQVLKQ